MTDVRGLYSSEFEEFFLNEYEIMSQPIGDCLVGFFSEKNFITDGIEEQGKEIDSCIKKIIKEEEEKTKNVHIVYYTNTNTLK